MGPLTAGAASALAFAAWSVRGRSSSVFGASVWRGPKHARAIALTFDDGPSPATPRVLELLAAFEAKATFFLCGANVRRHPALARRILTEGHETGNHTDTHPAFWRLTPRAVYREIAAAQSTIAQTTGVPPRWFRAPYGVRWPGVRQAQEQLELTGVMWTAIGRDWVLPAAGIVRRMERGAVPGAVWCLHDGRELQPEPDVQPMLIALHTLLRKHCAAGWRFVSVSELLGIK
ncbi:MAG TPA: polysaccharide deacetylase family protein [Bryobacteraceae bacterium]|nr:polysaccharide deacetylase family protein [Bryobacteraceae bacterium]